MPRMYSYCYNPCSVSTASTSAACRMSSITPTTLLQSVRDQLSIFQEKRGISQEENNFISLVAIIIQLAGQAMYAVFTLFFALFPVITIFLAILHFVLDRLVDIIATRCKSDILIKFSILCIQLTVILFLTEFVLLNIFLPILSMQINIISKMLLISQGSLVKE